MQDNEIANSSAGFTVKEIVIRLEAKMDTVIADHEHRLRLLESDNNERKGAGAIVMSTLAFMAAIGAVIGAFVH